MDGCSNGIFSVGVQQLPLWPKINKNPRSIPGPIFVTAETGRANGKQQASIRYKATTMVRDVTSLRSQLSPHPTGRIKFVPSNCDGQRGIVQCVLEGLDYFAAPRLDATQYM